MSTISNYYYALIDSLWRPEVDAEFLNGRYTTIKTFTRHPIGGSLSHDVGARNNQVHMMQLHNIAHWMLRKEAMFILGQLEIYKVIFYI